MTNEQIAALRKRAETVTATVGLLRIVDAAHAILELLDELEAMHKDAEWISVEDRLPPANRRAYLAWCAMNKCCYTAYLCRDESDDETADIRYWHDFASGERMRHPVTHWKLLPSGPEVQP